jgi:hypothetical protein
MDSLGNYGIKGALKLILYLEGGSFNKGSFFLPLSTCNLQDSVLKHTVATSFQSLTPFILHMLPFYSIWTIQLRNPQ